MAQFNQDVDFTKPAIFSGTVDMSGATVTPPTGQRVRQFVEVAFDRNDIQSGSKTWDALPFNIVVESVHIVMSAALVGGVASAKIGNLADDDGFGTATALAGSVGYRRFPPGALLGGVVAGGSNGVKVIFTNTGGVGTALTDIKVGAGSLVIDFVEMP